MNQYDCRDDILNDRNFQFFLGQKETNEGGFSLI